MRPVCALRSALIFLSLLASIAASAQSATMAYDTVDPFIGTAGGGNTFPGATLPFGMMQWSPDTNHDAWYFYSDKQIKGFSLTHISGAGCPLYGDFAVLPTSSALTAVPGQDMVAYPAAFDHSNEEAHPGFYAVTLANGIRVEITVAERAGIARFIFPAGAPARLLINAGSSANLYAAPWEGDPKSRAAYGNQIELTSDTSFAGASAAGGFCGPDSHYKIYVAGRFNKPYKSSALWQDNTISSDKKSAQGKHTGAWLDFGNEREIEYKVGISYVSEEGARNNLEKEIPGWEFETVHARARSIWSAVLDRISVEGGNANQREIFYTGVYHSFLSPNLFSDEDGNYPGFDGKVHALAGLKQKAQYANFSDWDIYRNTVQLQALFDPERAGDIMQSLVNDAVQIGIFPRWPVANDVTYVMGGDSPAIVLASSYAFGARNFDTEAALKYMVKAGTVPSPGPHNGAERVAIAEYLKYGFIPQDKDNISASETLEYANADFAVAQFAKNTGHPAEYQRFLKQSENWKNLLDPTIGWIRPRMSDGSWLTGFDADRVLPKANLGWDTASQVGFQEGNSYQYSYMVPFDYPALFAAVGGEDKVIPRLDKFFTKLRCWGEPCYNIENEPDFVVPYA